MKIFLFILFFFNTFSYGQEYLNFGFERINNIQNTPKFWHIGGKGYTISIDSLTKIEGKYSLRIKKNNENGSFGVFSGVLDDSDLRSKKIDFSCKIKTENVEGGSAGLWINIVDENNKTIYFENMDTNGIVGTNSWKRVSINTYIDSTMASIKFGGMLTGSGEAWFDDLEFKVNNKKYQPSYSVGPKKLNEKEKEFLKSKIYPISTVDPTNENFEDLVFLNNIIGYSKYVGLGEVTHGAKEIFQLKNRIIKYLIENLNFSQVLMESNMAKAYELNKSVLHGDNHETNKFIKAMGFWTWSTEEVKAMIEWLKLKTIKNNRLQFSGFDMQNYNYPLEVLKAVISDGNILDKLDELNTMLNALDATHRDVSDNIEVKNKINEVKLLISQNFDDSKDKGWYLKFLNILEQALDINLVNRDSYMSENINWIIDKNPNSKVAIWAHNNHITKSSPSMGFYLKKKYKKDFISIGFLFYQGRYTAYGENGVNTYPAEEAYPGTFEYLLNSINVPIFLLDLRGITKSQESKWLFSTLEMRRAGAIKRDNEFLNRRIIEDFDVIIFIKDITNSTLLD